MRRRRRSGREKMYYKAPIVLGHRLMARSIKPPTYLPIETWSFRVFDSLVCVRRVAGRIFWLTRGGAMARQRERERINGRVVAMSLIFSPTHPPFLLSLLWRNFWEFRRLSFTWAGERTEAIEATGGPSQDSTMAGNEQPVLYPTGERKGKKTQT